MISTKFYSGHDEEIYLSDWAEDGNMTEDRLKQLELEFLCAIDWNIYISNEHFFAKLTAVEKTLARRQGLRRGWLTYTELIQLLPSFTMAKFLLNNISVITVMAVSYAAGVMTIAGAFFLASQIPGNALHHGHRRADVIGGDSGLATNRVASDGCKNMLNSVADDVGTEALEAAMNITCPAFDVEEELQKLERQYDREQYLDGIRMKNNENDGPLGYLHGAEPSVNARHRGVMNDPEIHWYSFKDEYSDEDALMGCNLANCTKSILWNLLADAEKTFVKLPFMWFKFM